MDERQPVAARPSASTPDAVPVEPAQRDSLESRESVAEVRGRQRAEFGGFNWGAAFFGWLVAVGFAALLVAILSAAGAAIGFTEGSLADGISTSETGKAADNAETISVVGGVLVVAILMIAYYAGGYVAGRMSRFDGGRQGLGVWLLGLLMTIVLAVLGVIAGSEYNVLQKLDLPRIPIDEGDLTTGAAITLAAIVVGTLLAAIGGGKVGERYHRRVDRAGL